VIGRVLVPADSGERGNSSLSPVAAVISMVAPTLVSDFISATFRRWTLSRPFMQAPHDDAVDPRESTLLGIVRRVGEASDEVDGEVTCWAAGRRQPCSTVAALTV
jgi:hypothetical protein